MPQKRLQQYREMELDQISIFGTDTDIKEKKKPDIYNVLIFLL